MYDSFQKFILESVSSSLFSPLDPPIWKLRIMRLNYQLPIPFILPVAYVQSLYSLCKRTARVISIDNARLNEIWSTNRDRNQKGTFHIEAESHI